jgi:lysyl-tRNA synthetase class 2
LRAKGIDPFKNKFTPGETCAARRARNYAEGREVAVAGRITAHRDMGKSMFIDVRDQSGRIQIYAQKNVLGDEQFHIFTHLDLGDFIGVTGTLFTPRPASRASSSKLHHSRQGAAPAAREMARPRRHRNPLPPALSRFDRESRREGRDAQAQRDHPRDPEFFHARGYVEVETPMMQAIPGGAAAQPFKTFHNALGCEFYLRIALELYHKRLLVGGMDKLFEIGKNFRNEGLSRRHNPEFTMLEAYCAFGDYATMMETGGVAHHAESFGHAVETKDAEKVLGPHAVARAKYKDLVREKAGADWFDISPAERRQRAHDLGAEIGKEYEDFEVTGAVFEKLIEPTLIQPTFVTHLPKELVPLAKLSPRPDDRRGLRVLHQRPGNFARLHRAERSHRAARTLEHQAGGEQQKLDEDFLVALEHGMPPAGGIGIGIDRLCMMLLGQESIRDVILFPQLKPK